jgi:hypothetical protein
MDLLPQILVPVIAASWLWFWPQRCKLGFALQALSALLLLSGSALVAIWLAIPRWTLAIPALLWLWAIRQNTAAARALWLPAGYSGWLALAGSGVLALAGGWLTVEALLGRRPPAGPAIDLAMPLSGADLSVANGGSRLLVNAHQDTLDHSVPRHRLWHGQSYGVDLVALNALGRSAGVFRPADPSRYAIFGRAVAAPCAGTVVAARDGRPDQRVPQVDREVMPGNFVILRCAGADIAMAHLQQGSVAVKLDDRLAPGALIGRVGNSGMSDEPHLHINAQTPGTAEAPFSGRPVVMRFAGRFLVRGDRP